MIKIELKDSNTICKRLGIDNNGKAQLFLSTSAARRMDKYIPYDTGTLKDTHTIDTRSVTYTVPYARKQFYTNKGKDRRGSRWDLKMLSAERSQLAKEVENYIKRGVS